MRDVWNIVRMPPEMSQGALIMMLSIQFIFLSFFILLNAMTDVSRVKERPQQHRLDGYAHVDHHLQGKGRHEANWQTGVMEVQTLHEEVRGVVQNVLRLQTLALDEVAQGVRVRVPLARVMTAEGVLTLDGEALLGNLAAMLRAHDGWRMQVNMARPIDAPLDGRKKALLAMAKPLADMGLRILLISGLGPDVVEVMIVVGDNGPSADQLMRGLPTDGRMEGV